MPERFFQEDSKVKSDVESILNTIDDFVSMAGLEKQENPSDGQEACEEQAPKIDVEELKEKGFLDSQIHEIVLGGEEELPVEVYAKECFNWKQMREIRYGLLEKLNTEVYENPFYSAEQMREIRRGLSDKLDVSQYAKLYFSVTDMHGIRKKLMAEVYAKCPDIYDRVIPDEDTGISIQISANCMEAYLTVPKDSTQTLTVACIKNLLKRHEIEYGIMENAIHTLASSEIRETAVKVAEGKISAPGKNGWYELFFQNSIQSGPNVLPDGSVDYSNINIVDMVSVGRILARYHRAEAGQNAVTVNGLEVEGERGEELALLAGTGIKADADRGIYYAADNGYATYNEATGTLNVFNMYVIQGDVTYNSNCLEYDGNVHIFGSVRNRAVIRAKGDVLIEGSVEEADISAEQNVIIKGGVNGGLGGQITAGGAVKSSFFESAKVRAKGGVEGNYFLNCDIQSDDKIIARGNKSKIIGGKIVAAIAVEASVIGTYGTRTMIIVGDLEWLRGRLRKLYAQKESNEETIEKLLEGKQKLRNLFGDRDAEGKSLYQKTCSAISTKEDEQRDIDKEIKRLNRIIGNAGHAYVWAIRKLQQEVFFSINGRKKHLDAMDKGVRLTGAKDGGRHGS